MKGRKGKRRTPRGTCLKKGRPVSPRQTALDFRKKKTFPLVMEKDRGESVLRPRIESVVHCLRPV